MKEQIDNYKLQNGTLGQQDDNAGQMKRKTVKNSKSTTKDVQKPDPLKRKHLQYVKNLLSVIDLAFTFFISSFILSLESHTQNPLLQHRRKIMLTPCATITAAEFCFLS